MYGWMLAFVADTPSVLLATVMRVTAVVVVEVVEEEEKPKKEKK